MKPPHSTSASDNSEANLGSLKAIRWLALSSLVACLAAGEALAAVITGTVLNPGTQQYLERAVVRVQGTQFQTLTDRDGRFRLAGLPAGTHTIVASYAGLDEGIHSVTVGSDDAAVLHIELGAEVYLMEEFVVSTPLEGSAFAINQQRRAETIRSVTSIDAFIDNVTGNPGEFLRNVSGIQMDFSQVEPNAIRVRGFDPTLTTVTMDGNEIASADSSSLNRRVGIDQLHIGSIDNVEVFKAPIPSMSANAIGGIVNFNSQSAFNHRGRRIQLTLGLTGDSHDIHFRKTPSPGHGDRDMRRILPVGRFSYSNSFLDNRLGIVFSANYDDSNLVGSSTTNNLLFRALPGQTLPPLPTMRDQDNAQVLRQQFVVSPNRQRRTRGNVSLNTDLKVTEDLTLSLKSTFTDYYSTNRNHSFSRHAGTAYTADSTLETYTTTNGTASQGASVFDKYTQSWQFSPSLRYQPEDWKIELNGGFSKSINHYKFPDKFGGLSITLPNLGWTMSTPVGVEVPYAVVQNSGPDFYDLNNYRPNQGNLASQGQRSNHGGFVSNNVRNSSEVRYSGRLDVQRDLRLRFPAYIKGGLSYNETIRDRRQTQARWYWVGDDGIPGTADDTTAAGANLGRFAEPGIIDAGFPSVREPTYLSTHEVWKYWQANPHVLVFNEAYAAEQRFLGRRKVNEKITSAYLMSNVTIHKLNVLAGVRSEKTEIEALGSRRNDSLVPSGINVNSLEGVLARMSWVNTRSSYRSDPFKYLHLRYEWLPSLQTRASYTESIGRPNFAQILPSMSQNDNNMTVSVNNVGLNPQRSRNLDFSVEYYTKSVGEWTAAWFSRDVKDYISSTRLPIVEAMPELGVGAEFIGYDLITSMNLGFAKWSGYELGFRQQLRDWEFVPEFVKGVEIFANHTRIYEMEGDFGSPGTTITRLAGVAPKLFNAGISYRAPGGRFYVSLITNHQSPIAQDNLPPQNANAQRGHQSNSYQFWNAEVSYRVRPKFRVTATARNLFGERKAFSMGNGIVRSRQQDAGMIWMLAGRMDL